MKIDSNLVIICVTCIICVHIVMSKLLDIKMADKTKELMIERFDEIKKMVGKDLERRFK